MFNLYTDLVFSWIFSWEGWIENEWKSEWRSQLFNKGSITKCVVNSRLHSFRVDRMFLKLLVLWIWHRVSGSKVDVPSFGTSIHSKITVPWYLCLRLRRKYSMGVIAKHPIIHFIEFDSMWHRSFWDNKSHRDWKKKISWVFIHLFVWLVFIFLGHCYQIAKWSRASQLFPWISAYLFVKWDS